MLRTLLSVALVVLSCCLSSGQENKVVDGKREGVWRIVGKSGKVDVGKYVGGQKDGEWVTMSADSVVRSRVTFVRGIPQGMATYYYADGGVMESGYWNVDHWEGEYARYYDNGKKSCEFTYDAEGRRTGKQSYYHENGALMFEGEWREGKIKGALAIYNEEGRKVMERNYDEGGKYQGSQELVIEEGDKGESKAFRGSGSFTIYDERGRKEQTGTFKDGKLVNGDKFVYDENGKLVRVETYKNGKRVGVKKP